MQWFECMNGCFRHSANVLLWFLLSISVYVFFCWRINRIGWERKRFCIYLICDSVLEFELVFTKYTTNVYILLHFSAVFFLFRRNYFSMNVLICTFANDSIQCNFKMIRLLFENCTCNIINTSFMCRFS